ncbi:unnamed protein product, partial [Ectocarpus sp. 6 AP-2014]
RSSDGGELVQGRGLVETTQRDRRHTYLHLRVRFHFGTATKNRRISGQTPGYASATEVVRVYTLTEESAALAF